MSSGGFLQDYGSVLGPDGGDDDDDDERDTDGEVWKLRHSLTRNQPQRQNEGIRLNEGIPAGRGSSNPHLYNQPRKMYHEGRLHIGQPRPLSEYTGAIEPRNIKILGLYPEVHRDVMIPTQPLRVHEPPPPYHAQNFYIYPGRPGTLLYPPRSPGLIDLPLANPAEGPMFTPIAEPRSRSESKEPEEGGKYAVCSLSLAIAACICGSFLCNGALNFVLVLLVVQSRSQTSKMATFREASFERQLKTLLNFDQLEKPVQHHLKNVYSAFSITMLAAAVGAYVHMYTAFLQAGLLTTIAGIGLLVLLAVTTHNRENTKKRLGYLTGFAFFSGMSLGPLMEAVIQIDPSIVPTAFMATTVIFVCFSLCSLMSTQRYWLYLGGMLFSGLSIMLMLSLFNLFLGSQLLFELNLYLGLAVMCGFVLYDTQLIVEKRRMGDDDYVWHCVDLFLDFIQIFRKLMIILGNKEQKKKNNRD